MVQYIICFWIVIMLWLPTVAQTASVPVFTSGSQGYKSYRIPAIVKAPNGDLLAFAEGRADGSDDFGNIDIVFKRSHNQGKTWGPLIVLVDYNNLQAGNPAPVVDLLDPNFPKGRIFLFYNTGNRTESEVRKGNGLREVWYKTSTDGGHVWSTPLNITLQVHRPNQPAINPAYNFKEDWRSYANTPGHGLQFNLPPYKGRMYIAANHSAGNPDSHSEDYAAHGFYSDDHGASFKISAVVPMPGSNESTAAELSNGALLLNCRNQKGDIKARIIALSKNGGELWDTVFFDHRLPDPVCEGSILNVGVQNRRNILAFCNAADTVNRNKLTLRISYDEGLSWSGTYLVDEGHDAASSDYTAYSDVVKIESHKIGVVYEKADYSTIVFTRITWK